MYCLTHLECLHPRQLLLQRFRQLLLLQPATRRNGGCRRRGGRCGGRSSQANGFVEHLGKIGWQRGRRGELRGRPGGWRGGWRGGRAEWRGACGWRRRRGSRRGSVSGLRSRVIRGAGGVARVRGVGGALGGGAGCFDLRFPPPPPVRQSCCPTEAYRFRHRHRDCRGRAARRSSGCHRRRWRRSGRSAQTNRFFKHLGKIGQQQPGTSLGAAWVITGREGDGLCVCSQILVLTSLRL